MRKLKKKIGIQSVVELRQEFHKEAERLADEAGMRGGLRRVEPSWLGCWWIAWILSRSEEERERIAREGQALFARHVASDRPISVVVGGPSEPGPPRAGPGKQVSQPLNPHGEGTGDCESGGQLNGRPARKSRRLTK